MGLKNTLSELFKLGEIKDSVISLFEAKFELKKIEIQEKAERGVSELIFTLILLILGSVCSVFVLILGAFGLNIWLGEPFGYVIVLALLLILLVMIYSKKIVIKERIREIIQKEMDAMDS